MQPKSDSTIEQRAYEIWEAEGRPEGKHLEHWEQAARELGIALPEAAKAKKAPAKRTKATAEAVETAPKKRKAATPAPKAAAQAPAASEKPARATKRTKKTEPV
jgi:hypothetical protein